MCIVLRGSSLSLVLLYFSSRTPLLSLQPSVEVIQSQALPEYAGSQTHEPHEHRPLLGPVQER